MGILLQLDFQVTQFINALIPHNTFLDLFFSFFSLRGNSILIWIVIMMFLVIFEEKRERRFVIYFLITFFTTAFLVNVVIKNIVQRPRPQLPTTNYKLLTNTCPKDFSFPSGHASTAFAAATVITFYDKKRKWFYYSIASFISLSRIYLGCHYFFDVITGGLFGYLVSWIIFKYNFLSSKSH